MCVRGLQSRIHADVVMHVPGSLEAVRIARLSLNNILSNKCDDTLTKFVITLFPWMNTHKMWSLQNTQNVYIVGANIRMSVPVGERVLANKGTCICMAQYWPGEI